MFRSDLRHRDASGRLTVINRKDAVQERFIRPSDGRLAPLIVQGSDESNLQAKERSWIGTGKMRMQVSAILDLVHWTYSSVFEEGSEERRYDGSSMLSLALKWVPSCLLLVLMLLIPQNLEGSSRNGGFYDPVRYRDWGYSKASRNTAENNNQEFDEVEEPGESAPLLPDDIEMSAVSHSLQESHRGYDIEQEMDEDFDDIPARQYRPRYLCFLKDDARGSTSCETWKVTDWIKSYGDNADTDFVFLSYTRKQFCVATEQELAGWTLPDAETRAAYVEMARRDRATLHEYGIKAAQSAGKPAFWLDFECIRDADNQAKATSQSADVYRICDIVRAAHSMVILLGPPLPSRLPGASPQHYTPANMNLWLREWGTRLWTLPEILLVSPEHRVRIHAVGGPPHPEALAKRNFAARAWKDAKRVRQLIDHYESSIHLTPLELVSIALECFAARQTDQFAAGDLTYALMGLLRRRPATVASDTSFEAFARLSLANDSDALLERLLCMLPASPHAPWHELRDAWGVRLWDIEPRCQVAGIVDDGTVTLDGAFGATVQWDSADQVAFFKRPTLARTFGKILLRGVPLYLVFGLVFTIAGAALKAQIDASNRKLREHYPNEDMQSTASAIGLLVPGIVFLVPSALVALAAPAMLLDIYRGKFWSTQALFVGVEGLVDVGEAERHLFGFNHGRLKWSTNGSTLSRHRLKDGECVSLPPAVESEKKEGQTLFTLIDTYAMTATCFYAERPPVAVMICGQEGGMQRAVLCSYDWRTQTFARETVLRMKTLVLDRMFRVDRFRFALRRRVHEQDAEMHRAGDHEASGLFRSQGAKVGTRARHWEMWKIDLALLPFMWFVYAFLYMTGPNERYPNDGLAYYAGFLVSLRPGLHLFRRQQIGHVISTSLFTLAALAIGNTFVDSGSAGSAAIMAFVGAFSGILTTAFVFLTGAWYNTHEQPLRIIVWGYGSVLAAYALLEISNAIPGNIGTSLYGYQLFQVVYSIIYMLLAGLGFFFIGTPDQVRWMSPQERARFTDRKREQDPTTGVKEAELLKKPQTWFFFFTSLFNSAFVYVQTRQLDPDLPGEHSQWETSAPAVLVAILVGFILTKVRNFRIFVIAASLSLQSAASIVFGSYMLKDAQSYGSVKPSLAGFLIFLMRLGGLSQCVIWSLLLSNITDTFCKLTTLGLTFAGYAIGGMISSGYWKFIFATPDAEGYSDFESYRQFPAIEPTRYVVWLCALFGLQIITLIAWYMYYWRANRGIAKKRAYLSAPVAASNWSGRSEILEHEQTRPRTNAFRFTT